MYIFQLIQFFVVNLISFPVNVVIFLCTVNFWSKSFLFFSASCPASCIQQSVSAHGDQSNIFLTINQPTAKSRYGRIQAT